MVLLLRNLTDIRVEKFMPSPADTSEGADLFRIHHHRNKIAHSDEGYSEQEFNNAWEEIKTVCSF